MMVVFVGRLTDDFFTLKMSIEKQKRSAGGKGWGTNVSARNRLLWRYPASGRWTFLTGSAWCRRARRPASACPASAGSSAWSGARWARTARWWSSSGPGRTATSWARRRARRAARSCPASRRTRSRAPAFRTLEQKNRPVHWPIREYLFSNSVCFYVYRVGAVGRRENNRNTYIRINVYCETTNLVLRIRVTENLWPGNTRRGAR